MPTTLPDPNEIEAYGFLRNLHAGELEGKLTSRAVESYLASSKLALELPRGEGRECLLRTLNSGVNSAQRVSELSVALAEAQTALKAENPGRSEALQAHSTIGQMLGNMQQRLREAFKTERAAGRDSSGTAFFVFEHDMAGVVTDIRRVSSTLLRVAPAERGTQDSESA